MFLLDSPVNKNMIVSLLKFQCVPCFFRKSHLFPFPTFVFCGFMCVCVCVRDFCFWLFLICFFHGFYGAGFFSFTRQTVRWRWNINRFCTCLLILLFQEHGFGKWNVVVYGLALKVLWSFYEVWPLWVLILCFGCIFCRGNEWTTLGFLSLIKTFFASSFYCYNCCYCCWNPLQQGDQEEYWELEVLSFVAYIL